ncbi:bestrophin-like domain [Streptomyces sp. NPDC003027]
MVLLETIAIVLGVALLAALAVVVKTKLFPVADDEEPREDVAEYIAMMVSVLYAVVLGLCLVSVWDNRSAAADHVQVEASALHQTYLLAGSLPEDRRGPVRAAARSYASHVVGVEWPLMAEGRPLGSTGWNLLDRLRAAGEVDRTASTSEQIAAQELVAQLSSVDDARRGREASAQERLPPVLWTGLLIGGALTLAFMFLFGVQRSVTHVVMVMGLAGFIAFTVLLIHQLNAPFGAVLGATADPFTRYFGPA